MLVAVGVNDAGFRDILGGMEGPKEDIEGWRTFLRHLKQRGLKGIRMIVSDKCLGLVEAASEIYPEALWQRCVVHWYRNILSRVPRRKMADVAAMLKAIHAQEDVGCAQEKAVAVVKKLQVMKLQKAAEHVEESFKDTFSYFQFPRKHHRRLRTNNMLERVMREIRRRTRVVGCFPDGHSAVMLAAARLRYVSGSKWGSRRYLDMDRLKEWDMEQQALTDKISVSPRGETAA